MASFVDTWLMASFFGLVRASAKILRPRSHGRNFWPPESVGEDFFIDGLVAPPFSSVVLCSRTSPPFLGHLQPPARANSRRENHAPTTEQTDFSALQTSPSRISALAVFPSPRESQQQAGQSTVLCALSLFGAKFCTEDSLAIQ